MSATAPAASFVGAAPRSGKGPREAVMKCLVPLAATLAIGGCTKPVLEFPRVTETWVTDEGTFVLDHVTGRKMDLTRAVRRKFLGRTYYFEREGNAALFELRPWCYLFADPSGPVRPVVLP